MNAEEYRRREDQSVVEWFKLHRALVDDEGRRLTWKRPGTTNYAVYYNAIDSRLLVGGDLGHAIYRVNSEANLQWWASCDLGYFASKCEASECGRGYRSWDADAAKSYLEELTALDPTRRNALERERAWEALGSKYEWSEWLGRYGAVLGHDWYEYGDIGMTLDRRCRAHLYGLKLAYHQLENRPLPEWMVVSA